MPPGCENGRRFVFEGEGNQRPGMEPGPVVYVAAALKHPIFTRTGDHLVYAAKIPLIDSLCGATLKLIAAIIFNIQPWSLLLDGDNPQLVPNFGVRRLAR